MRTDLRTWLADARRVVITGVGNALRRDDFVGVAIVRHLQHKTSDQVRLFECETTPESFLDPILAFQPTHVLIIDAALLHLDPGAAQLLDPSQLVGVPVSTHTLPLHLFATFITKTTRARVAILAIQPKDTDFGEGLTTELKRTVTDLSNLLVQLLP